MLCFWRLRGCRGGWSGNCDADHGLIADRHLTAVYMFMYPRRLQCVQRTHIDLKCTVSGHSWVRKFRRISSRGRQSLVWILPDLMSDVLRVHPPIDGTHAANLLVDGGIIMFSGRTNAEH